MSVKIAADGSVALKIIRDFNYSAEQVFEAWLNPKYLVQWMGPTDEINVTNVEVEAVEGGRYHMQFNGPGTQVDKLNGVYKIINRFSRLVFTWTWEKPTDGGGEETLVSLDFLPISGGTRLTLLHQKFSSMELAERHAWGWDETLQKFERRANQILSQEKKHA